MSPATSWMLLAAKSGHRPLHGRESVRAACSPPGSGVSVTGGGLTLADPDADARPTGLVPYTRYEPVPPPELVVPAGLLVANPEREGRFRVDPALLGPGGALERLVVRTAPLAGGFSTAEFEGNPAYPANDSRTFGAPSTTFQLAEQHGVLSLGDRVTEGSLPELRFGEAYQLRARVADIAELASRASRP